MPLANMPPNSAIPLFYWLVFGCYEPILSIGGAVGAFVYPLEVSAGLQNQPKKTADDTPQTYRQQAPWPNDSHPESPLPTATVVTLYQLAHTVALLGALNIFVLWAARKHLWSQPAIQEKVVRAQLTPLLFGDVLHIVITLWALGDERWDVSKWGGILWLTIISGLTLFVPRVAWHMGVGRYVAVRDGKQGKDKQ